MFGRLSYTQFPLSVVPVKLLYDRSRVSKLLNTHIAGVIVANQTSSSSLPVSCGVPQGSILGPLLFLIYINDMVSVSDLLFYVLFADDSNVFLSGKNIDQVITDINGALVGLVEWLNTNKLTLNVKKTHFMVFNTPRSNIPINNHVIINGQTIDRVESTRFLGVLLDSKLTFKHHISHIRSKVAKGIYILGRARKFFDEITLKDLYYAFIHPYFHYCNEVWGSTYSTYLDPLIKLQKHALRIIAGVSRNHHTFELFQRYNIIQLKNLYKFSVYLFLYKLCNKKLPYSIQSSYTFNHQIHHYFTRQADNLHVYKCSSEARKRSLRHQCSILYNTNSDINYSVSVASFKFAIKTLLFNTNT